MQINPLIEQGQLLDFAQIRPEHITPAIDQLMSDADAVLARVTNEDCPATWDDVVIPLDTALTRLGRAWGAVGHLTSVMDTPDLRAVYNENLPRVSQWFIALSQNLALMAQYKKIRQGAQWETLNPLRQRIIDKALLDFHLSGADLPETQRTEMAQIGQELSQLSQTFSEHLLDATNATFFDITDIEELEGIPADVLSAYHAQAQAAGFDGWRITLHIPSYLPAMQYAKNRQLREKLYRAYITRASDLGPAEQNNTPLIAEILKHRRNIAKLLNLDSYACVSLATKMAKNPAQVMTFLRDIAKKAHPKGEADFADLQAFAKEEMGFTNIEPWDIAYLSEALRRARYAYSEEEVRQYFTVDQVFQGLFDLVERLFGLQITRDTAPVWHPDVQFWRIERDGQLIAQFYTDLYARSTKRGGAWMDNDSTYAVLADGSVRTPIAFLVCNFSEPINGNPALLRHDDVITLFHEFGHGLHHMLSRVPESDLSGINGVEWDAVELPSQFMENWAWNYETLVRLSRHVHTGEVLPRELFDKMLAAKNFQAGMQCLRQLEFALFDMRIHAENNFKPEQFGQILNEVRQEVSVVPTITENRFAQSFSHIFAGGYAAGYYSYKWAEVLSADAFSAFEEEGLFNPTTARRWVDEVLSRGGSRDAIDNFKAFRGREPQIEPLLRHSGIL